MLKRLKSYLLINALQASGRIWLYQPSYNRYGYPLLRRQSMRGCMDRMAFIERSLPFDRISSYLDVGSQLGFFPLYVSAKYPHISSVGIDEAVDAITYANALGTLNKVKSAHFVALNLTAETVKTLGEFDAISFLSVFHHIVARQGFEAADAIMRAIVEKCCYFVFETGQSNEPGYSWSESAAYMGSNSDDWLLNYLASLGLTVLATEHAPTHAAENKRSVFVCRTRKSCARRGGARPAREAIRFS